MGRREIELRDAMAGAWAAAKVSGGQFRQLVPVYSNRMGLAYQVMLGQQVQRRGRRAILVSTLVAIIGGAAVAVAAERMIAHRKTAAAEETEPATEPVAAFTG
jgi:hypothetical protein